MPVQKANTKLMGQIMVLALFLVIITGETAPWRLPMTIQSSNKSYVRTIGGDENATDGYDAELDIITPPPPSSGFYVYLAIADFPNYLDTDIRYWSDAPFDSITWSLQIIIPEGNTSSILWHPDSLPTVNEGGFFIRHKTNPPINMRHDSLLTVAENAHLTVLYIPNYMLQLDKTSGGDIQPPPGTYYYQPGEVATIKALPDTGYEFVYWKGDSTITQDSCTIIMHRDMSLVATFQEASNIKTASRPGQDKFNLYTNYPNPFNPTTTIHYELAQTARTILTIVNIRGEKMITLVDSVQPRGCYSVEWHGTRVNGQPVPSGLYFYHLQVDEKVKVEKMLLAR
ncbi:T9SS type A sorting domain-containing protein [candidate division KSB1 bacterium]|nr:T9SS type A sorting domain-containing protein [candidate division KSB1 bacterium]